jgi:hypothetical protein
MMKRIANPYAPLLAEIFNLKREVRIYRMPEIHYDNSECCALYWPPKLTNNKTHKIIIADKWSDTLGTYLGCIAHEYIHAWQDEKNLNYGHGEKSQFMPWARYLRKYYGITV